MTNPRGIRNNNPGNIEWGDPWQGLRPVNERNDSRFAQFTTPAYGIRALARTLITYQDKHNIRTVRKAIRRWAPPVENDTGAYVNQVAKAMDVGPDTLIDMHDWRYLKPMVEAIIRHENGPGTLKTANSWYDDATINEGLRLAGVRQPITEAANIPVTKETVGATATATVGIAQILDVLPAISAAITKSEDHLTSGNVARIVLGLVTIAIAGFIAWSQVKKHRAGAL